MNVRAHVTLIRQERSAGVQTGTDPDPAGAQSLDDRAGRLERAGGRGEREEERIALGIDLDPTLLRA